MSDRNVQSRTTPRKGKADAWMPLYVADYIADTTHLSTEEHGAYLLLLMAAWKRGGRLPVDDKQLANIAGMKPAAWRRASGVVLAFFHPDGGELVQKRMLLEIERASDIREKKAVGGVSGGSVRWGEDDRELRGREMRSQRLSAARQKATHSKEEWSALVGVCDKRCVRCGDAGPVVKDHILPIYRGGSDGIDNLQPLCRRCNSSKGPESIDHRPSDWRERLAKCLTDACLMPAQSQSQSQSQYPSLPSQEDGLVGGVVVRLERA